jgi:hypothetical protein
MFRVSSSLKRRLKPQRHLRKLFQLLKLLSKP